MENIKYIEGLFYKYRDRCYSFFLNIFNYNHELSKDMVQELFLRLLQKEDIAAIENIDSYIYNICKNLAYDHFRRENHKLKHLKELSNPQKEILHGSSLYSTEELVELNYLLRYAGTKIDALPLQQRTIFIMNKRDGLSIKEIADKLNLSPNTVRNHLHRSVKRVRNSTD